MSRRPRLQLPGAVYHVMSRGNRRALIFQDDADHRQFLLIVRAALRRYRATCHAFCLMRNHYHLVLVTPRPNLSATMRHINGVFAQTTNRRRALTGHLFESRFRSFIIERETYLKRAVRYVVRNPVRAGLVKDPAAWEWSSYRAIAGLEPGPDWLSLEWLEWTFRADARETAQERFCRYVNEPPESKAPLRAEGGVAGSAAFKARVAAAMDAARKDRLLPARTADAENAPSLAQLFAVCQMTSSSVTQWCGAPVLKVDIRWQPLPHSFGSTKARSAGH